MADNRHLTLKRGQKGAVLIPVLLFSSIVTLGILVLLQSQWLQKKSVADFKFFLEERKKNEQTRHHYQSLNTNALLKNKSIKLIQQFPSNLHYQNTYYDYYFQIKGHNYIYKLNQSRENKNGANDLEVILPSSTKFNYQNRMIKLIKASGLNQDQLYLYDINNHDIVFKAHFEQAAAYQLVGTPVNSIYVSDRVGLYKIDLSNSDEINLKLLKVFDSDFEQGPVAPIVTRDSRGDGRIITVLDSNKNKKIVYHEPTGTQHDFLDLFKHYDFS